MSGCYKRLLGNSKESEDDPTSETGISGLPASSEDDADETDEENEAHNEDDPPSNKGRRVIGNSLLQAVSHPFNLEPMFRRLFTVDELQNLRQELSQEGSKQTLLDHLQSNKVDFGGVSNFQAGLKKLTEFQEPAFGGLFNMGRLLKLATNEVRMRASPCTICGQTPPHMPVFSLNVSRAPEAVNNELADFKSATMSTATRAYCVSF